MASSSHVNKSSLPVLMVGALGVVFGDIGTSVLYTVKEVFNERHNVPFTPDNLYGILSLVVWTLTMIVAVKYVILVMRADNNGEGGLIALLALASRSLGTRSPALRRVLLMVGIFGACLFYGDGVITPSISVLSAVEGLEVISPNFKHLVIPFTLLVLFLLFWWQKRGTGGIGKFFGPVMLAWFASIAVLGAYRIIEQPTILWALWPVYALGFIARHPGIAFIILGAVVLCVTGAEALYADMGHFGRYPIRLAWFCLAMPALVLNYLGQGALLLAHPEARSNPFFHLAPSWVMLPLVGLATVATVIASQSLIAGAFSVTKQAIQLGFLPRLQVRHTSTRDLGQVYLPFVNWALFAMIVLTVMVFKSSDNLAAAYGIAVTTDMLITTILTFFVIRYGWGYPLTLCLAATGVFFIIDFTFFSSNLIKLIDGGWFPLLIAGTAFLFMTTWRRGRELMGHALRASALELQPFLDSVFLAPPARVPGTAVFLIAQPGIVPNALLHNLKHNKVLHEQNLFVHVRNHELPWIGMDKRLELESLGHDCWEVVLNYGFKNDPDLPRSMALLKGRGGIELDPMQTSYFLSRDIVTPSVGAGMSFWREKLFAQMHHNATSAAEFMNLPNNEVVELGSKVQI